ncbi:hypothetical protein RRG08_062318 [Elysia crispata]|uniref:Uncharacterized protein n=1 Tax=Elysia crispata TaxID=231223 RepID=A0AAE0YG54_9GAST|nr:hypothetical protein RRG08_062318 [Elysia crispata]
MAANRASRAGRANQDGVPGDPITAIVVGNGPWEVTPYVWLVPSWQQDDSLMSLVLFPRFLTVSSAVSERLCEGLSNQALPEVHHVVVSITGHA